MVSVVRLTDRGYSVFWDETTEYIDSWYSTQEAAQVYADRYNTMQEMLPDGWTVAPDNNSGGYNIIHDGKTIYYDNLGDTEEHIMRHTMKDSPIDEGLPPPVSAEMDAVDAVIELEVTDAPVFTSGTRGIIGTIKALFTKPEPSTGFKAYGDHWIGVYSNNFEDREGEIFPAKAIDEYIGRLDAGIVPQPELWVWHTGGSRIGKALTTFRVGGFVVSLGAFDDSKVGQHAKKALAKEKDLAMSHGFTYDPAAFDGRHYWRYNTFEISVLPRKAAANFYTSFEEIKAMAMSKDQRDLYERVTGEKADEFEGNLEKTWKTLAETGIATKAIIEDFTAVPDDEPAVSEKTIAEASKAFGALVTDLTESQGELANMQLEGAKALTAFKSDVDARLTAATKAISDLTALVTKLAGERPRVASQDEDNTIESAGLSKQITAALMDDEGNYETVAGIRVRKMQR